jgi:hypothetical protein
MATGINPKPYLGLPPVAAFGSQQLPAAINSNAVGFRKASDDISPPNASWDPANMKLAQRPGPHGNVVVDLKIRGSKPVPPGPNTNGDWCGTGRVGGVRPK